MLVWTAGMNFIGRPLSYASVKLRPFSPVSPTFLPQWISASLIFLFSPVLVQRAQLCTGRRKTPKRWQFDLSSLTTVIQAHSCFFCSPHPPPLKHPPPCWGWRAVGACFRSPPFLTAEHELCHSEHMSFTGTALNSILSIQGLLRSGNIWGIYRDHWQPWQNQLLRHGVSLYWLGQDRIYSIMVHYKFYTTA